MLCESEPRQGEEAAPTEHRCSERLALSALVPMLPRRGPGQRSPCSRSQPTLLTFPTSRLMPGDHAGPVFCLDLEVQSQNILLQIHLQGLP